MNEEEYQILNNYVLFKEVGSDAIGINYRGGEIDNEKRKISNHFFITEVYPFLFNNPNVWKKVNILLEGVKKSNIPKLYSPQNIIQEGGKHYLVYSHFKGKTLEQLLEDSTKKDNPISFDLAFSLAFAIGDLIDIGSSIVVSGEKSFHGLLTPDNIFIDYDGKIFLKNYGIYPYLSREENIFSEMVTKYGAWIAPEFLRKEKLVSQTDIYHLGYIIYRILTGKYYSYSPEEDFDTKFSNISFAQYIPSADKEFLTNIITFFKKTLHPVPSQRFANIKEFKDYISNNFHIEELSSVTFSLAYFMNSLYLETIEEENKQLDEELEYVIPEEKEEEEEAVPAKDEGGSDHLVEGILTGLEEQKKSRMRFVIPLIILIVVIIAISTFVIINQQKQVQKQREVQQKTAEEMRVSLEKYKSELETEYQKRLKNIEEKAATTKEEKAAQEEEITKLKEWQKEQMRIALEKQKQKQKEEEEQKKAEEERLKKEAELKKQKELEEEQKRLEEEKKKKEQEELKKKLEEEEKLKNQVKEGDLIALTEVDSKPKKLKGVDPSLSKFQRNKYKGSKMTLRAMLLIDENGKVSGVKLLGNTPDDLKSTFEKTLKRWEFKPATKKGTKVKVWFPVAIKIDI